MSQPITIAGGGLAGLSLGIALRQRGIEVQIHEAGSYPRHRVCGEFICGVSPAALEKLGITAAFQPARKLVSTAWYRHDELLLQAPLGKPAWGISRFELDQQLRLEFQKLGGELHERSRLKNEPREGLVWSAGRVPERGDWIGLKCHVRNLDLAHDLEMHLGNEGYIGLARIENEQVNICGLFRRRSGIEGRGSELLLAYLNAAGLTTLAQIVRRAERDETSFLGVAGFRLGYQSNRSGAVAIGDAYAMIPPFTGNGMSMAFESASVALDPLTDYAKNTANWSTVAENIRHDLARKFSVRMKLSQILHPFLTFPVAQKLVTFIARRGWMPYNSCFHALR